MVRDMQLRERERNLLQHLDSNEGDEDELNTLMTASPVSNNHMQVCYMCDRHHKTLIISITLNLATLVISHSLLKIIPMPL